MKWNNRGHEFDNLVKEIEGKRIFLYGCGTFGTDTYQKLKYIDCIEGFIDNYYMGDRYLDKPVYSFEHFCGEYDEVSTVIIVCIAKEAGKHIFKECSDMGWKPNKTLFDITECDFIIPFLYTYCHEMIYLKSFSLSVTEYCSLQCKECALSYPYFTDKKNYDIEDIKENLKSLFMNVDFIYFFEIIGGEPFLYPQLEEVLYFVYENYRSHIGKLAVTTNATILPKRCVLETMKQVGATVYISDYSQVPRLCGNTDRLKGYLENNQVMFDINDQLVWTDFGLNKQNVDNTDDIAKHVMEGCGIDCVTVQDEKLYYCFPALNAGKLFYSEVRQDDNYIDLKYNTFTKRELMEWLLGYREKGYLEMCKHCYGQYCNTRYVIPGLQMGADE